MSYSLELKEKINAIKILVKKYKKEIEDLNSNFSISEQKKIDTICVLREVVFDLENILNGR